MTTASFGDVLRALRMERKLSLRDLADRVGRNVAAVRSWEDGNSFPIGQDRIRLQKCGLRKIESYWHLIPKLPSANEKVIATVLTPVEPSAPKPMPEPSVEPESLPLPNLDAAPPDKPPEPAAPYVPVARPESWHPLPDEVSEADADAAEADADAAERKAKKGSPMSSNTFGKALAAARAEEGKTQVQIAKEIGIHPITYGYWEQGRGMPMRDEHRKRLIKRYPSIAKFLIDVKSDVKSDEATKKCARCQETKPLSAFNKDVAHGDGRAVYCRECRAELKRAWRKREQKPEPAKVPTKVAAKVARKPEDKPAKPSTLSELGARIEKALAAAETARARLAEAKAAVASAETAAKDADADADECIAGMQQAMQAMRGAS